MVLETDAETAEVKELEKVHWSDGWKVESKAVGKEQSWVPWKVAH